MDESVTVWIRDLKAGDADAARRLWDRYFRRLAGLAKARIDARHRRAADEEDVALSAFHSLCRGAARGRFPDLADRGNLWALLLVLTRRKACDHVGRETAAKRGGGRVAAAADLDPAWGGAALDAAVSREPSPEEAAGFADECDRLLGALDDGLRRLAVAKLEGRTNEEVAAEAGCAVRTVERRLDLIRKTWERVLSDPAHGRVEGRPAR